MKTHKFRLEVQSTITDCNQMRIRYKDSSLNGIFFCGVDIMLEEEFGIVYTNYTNTWGRNFNDFVKKVLETTMNDSRYKMYENIEDIVEVIIMDDSDGLKDVSEEEREATIKKLESAGMFYGLDGFGGGWEGEVEIRIQ